MPIHNNIGGVGSAPLVAVSGPSHDRDRCDALLLGRSLVVVQNTPTYASMLQSTPRPSMATLGLQQTKLPASSPPHERFASQLQGTTNVGVHQASEQPNPIKPVALSGLACGFASTEEFSRFANHLRVGLSKAGYENVEPILQGSAVTGTNFRTGMAFDVRRTSDFDVALAGSDLLKKAESQGIGLRSGGRRTGPLTVRDLNMLGLNDLSDRLSRQAGREVNFMIFGSVVSATSRAPSVMLPK